MGKIRPNGGWRNSVAIICKHITAPFIAWYKSAQRVTSAIPWRVIWSDAKAASYDLGQVTRWVGRRVTNPHAQKAYLAILAVFTTWGIGWGAHTASATLQKYRADLADPHIIMSKKKTGVTLLDRNGTILYQGYGATERHNVSLGGLPPGLIQATLAAEDADFYAHRGISIRGTLRAAYKDLRHQDTIQGGSTITQQLVKNTLLTSEKSFKRKFSEIVLSFELEKRYSKNQIMQMYLNSIYYGQGSYGIESAAQAYFNKPAKQLTLAESALLAGLPQSPSTYDPNVDRQAATSRRNFTLRRMQEIGYIDAKTTKSNVALAVKTGTRSTTIKAPHFVFYTLELLRNQYGRDMVERGGITVQTSLDLPKQRIAEQVVSSKVAGLASYHATNGGLVSLDTKTGEVMAMVGSADYNNPQFGNVNVTLAELQPGSSFKPIAYVTAFAKGWNGSTKVEDKPLRIPQSDGQIYIPQNYDQTFRGSVSLRRALANSLNIPAIEVIQHAGIHDTIATAHNLGITSLNDESRYGVSLVLGGGEVRPIDMATAYAGFANNGQAITPKPIISVRDRVGKNITKPSAKPARQVVDPRLAYMVTNILSDNQARVEEFGLNSPLQLSRPAAAKSGTTDDFRDNWTVGYTPELVTAVWVGNNDHSPMSGVNGVTGAAPIWHEYMEKVLAGTPIQAFSRPAGLIDARVCLSDGGLVGPNDPRGVTELFLAEAPPNRPCGAHVPMPRPTQPSPTNPPVLQQAVAPPTVTPTLEPGMGGGSGGDPPATNTPSAPIQPHQGSTPIFRPRNL